MRNKETLEWLKHIDSTQNYMYNGWHFPSANDLIPTKELDLGTHFGELIEFNLEEDYCGKKDGKCSTNY